eukprot:12186939-Alexandrium_andersonii.AAC.1
MDPRRHVLVEAAAVEGLEDELEEGRRARGQLPDRHAHELAREVVRREVVRPWPAGPWAGLLCPSGS